MWAKFLAKVHKKKSLPGTQKSEPIMPSFNTYISTAKEVAEFLSSSDNNPKQRPIWGAPGLSIQKQGARWSFTFKHQGTRYHGTLGVFPAVSLKDAKAAYSRKRFAVESGNAPKPKSRSKIKIVTPQKTDKRTQELSHITVVPTSHAQVTFNDVSAAYFHSRLEQLEAKGTNKLPAKAVARMENLFERYAQPVLGDLPVSDISNTHLIQILSNIESDTSRIKLKSVLSIFIKWLIQQSLLNPDQLNLSWSVINSMTPRETKATENCPRVAVAEIPRFVTYALRERDNFRDRLIGLSTVFVTLTAQRVGSIFSPDTPPIGNKIHLFCHWENVDWNASVLNIPSSYMKVSQLNGRSLPPFRVPLSREAIWCLGKIKELWHMFGIDLQPKDFLVPQYDDPSFPQKSFTLRHFIKEKLHTESLQETGKGFFDPDQTDRVATTHGLRSSFADWAAANGYAEDLIEKALAHTMPKIQRAYRRDDLLEARRPMMEAWGAYCFSMLPFKI